MNLISMLGARTGRAVSKRGGGLLSGFAAVALFGAMLVLAACGGNGGSVQAQAGPKNYDGYFLTQNADGDIECLTEDLTVMENADGTVDSRSVFGTVTIRHRGYKAMNSGGGAEIFGLGYVAVDSDGSNMRNPGIYYLQKLSDNRYGGLWIGKPNMPQDGSEGMICPYIMVPDPDDMDDRTCTSDIETMLDDTCYRTNANGFVNTTAIQ